MANILIIATLLFLTALACFAVLKRKDKCSHCGSCTACKRNCRRDTTEK